MFDPEVVRKVVEDYTKDTYDETTTRLLVHDVIRQLDIALYDTIRKEVKQLRWLSKLRREE